MSWNRSKGKEKKKEGKRRGIPSALQVLLAVVILLAGVVIVVLCMSAFHSGDGKIEDRGQQPERKQIPQVPPQRPQVPVEEKKVVSDKPRKVFKTYTDEKGVLRYEGGMVVRKPPVRTIKVGDHKPSIFKHVAEMQIQGLLEIEPGDLVVGEIEYGKHFTDSLRESFKDDIVINADDDANTRECKQAVMEIKKELKDRMANGEDVAKLMSDSRADLQRLGMYRQELENQVRSILDEKLPHGELSDQDVKDLYAAANKMLESKGIPALRMPTKLFLRAMRRSASLNREDNQK